MIRLFIIALMMFPVLVLSQEKSVLYLNGKAHLGNGKYIEKSAIGVKDGKFNLVANALLIKIDSSAFDTIIDLKGRHIYPAFIAPNSTLGLTEIDAVRASRDFREVGIYNPNIRAIIAYNTDSEIIPTVRSNGVLLAQATPRGGRITGTSSVMMLDGDNWEEAVYRKDDGIHVNWPSMYKRAWGRGDIQKDSEYETKVDELKAFLSKAKAYSEIKNPEEIDLRFEAFKSIFDGSKTLYVSTDYIKEIIEVIQLKKAFKIKKLVIVGGYDAWMIPQTLLDNDVTILLKRLHSLPERPEDDIDLPFKLPKMLQDLKIPFCLDNSGDMEAMGTRNLPFYAGTAVAYGLDYEAAVASISLSSAKMLGIDHRTGSIEKGKDANFFISSGDALDMRTNNVEHAFLLGQAVDLDNKQKQLYRKYAKEYNLDIQE